MNNRKSKLADAVGLQESPFMRELPPGYPSILTDDEEFMRRYREVQTEFYSRLAKIQRDIEENPNFDGWIRLCELLGEARNDKRVASSLGASEFVELMIDLASDSLGASSAKQAIEPLLKALINDKQREKAQSRNADKRAWVQEEWKKHGRSPDAGYRGNKTDFSRAYAKRLKNEFEVEITVESIRDRWLKGL